jgi:hypothetical protein
MHFRYARAEFVARVPYRRERGFLLQGTLIVRVALLAGPTCLCARRNFSEPHVGPNEVRPLPQKATPMRKMARWSVG